jgi:hypothetical protein
VTKKRGYFSAAAKTTAVVSFPPTAPFETRGAVKKNDESDVHLPQSLKQAVTYFTLFFILLLFFFLIPRFWAFRNKGSSKTRFKKNAEGYRLSAATYFLLT